MKTEKAFSYPGYTLTKQMPIEELQCTLLELVHDKTQSKILYIHNDDPENVFCIFFPTHPDTSNGVPHILEHTVLCGSKKYPVKDPFFSMTRRSLNTFMNAFTGSDFTCYPAASQIETDFYNLLDVYLDAVFHPLLTSFSFEQEGWRLEFEEEENANSPLKFKGIVFNEMKGALSSPSERLSQMIYENLLPDLTYGKNSGGDPKEIPHLTHEELLAFHRYFYTPSKALFYFYGNLPLEKHLAFLDTNLFKDAVKEEPLPPFPLQKRFTSPKKIEGFYPIENKEGDSPKGIFSFTALTTPSSNQEEVLALTLLETLLMGNDGAKLKKALLSSGFCSQASSFLDTDISEVPFSFILKGVDPKNKEEIELFLQEALKKLIHTPFPEKDVESALHNLEFHRKEITGNHTPYGLSLFLRAALMMQHGAPPEQALLIHSLFTTLREHLKKEPLYLNHLLEKYLVKNSHTVSIFLQPDTQMHQKEEEEEKKYLQSKKEALSSEEKELLITKAIQLKHFQEKEEDEEVLPKLLLKDVSKEPKHYLLSKEEKKGFTLFTHTTFTNDIFYLDLCFDLKHVEKEDLPFLRLFLNILPQLGMGERPYDKNLNFIQAHTGGLGCHFSYNGQIKDPSLFFPYLSFHTKALSRNKKEAFQLIQEALTSTNYQDEKRIKELLLKMLTGLEQHLAQNGLNYALKNSTETLSDTLYLSEMWGGYSAYLTMKHLALNFETEKHSLFKTFERLQKTLFHPFAFDLVITASDVLIEEFKNKDFYGLGSVLEKQIDKEGKLFSFPLKREKEALSKEKPSLTATPLKSAVAFNALSFKTLSYAHEKASHLSLAASILDHVFLHKAIREQGGAYGGGASSLETQGIFYLYSYRDPHIYATYKAFQNGLDGLVQGLFSEEDIEEAKLDILQELDAPMAPGSRGQLAYTFLKEGKTPELRKQFRTGILEATKEDIVKMALFIKQQKEKESYFSSFAEKKLLEKEAKKFEKEGVCFPLLKE